MFIKDIAKTILCFDDMVFVCMMKELITSDPRPALSRHRDACLRAAAQNLPLARVADVIPKAQRQRPEPQGPTGSFVVKECCIGGYLKKGFPDDLHFQVSRPESHRCTHPPPPRSDALFILFSRIDRDSGTSSLVRLLSRSIDP